MGPWWGVLILGGFSMLAERRSVYVGSNAQVTVSVLPIAFAAVVFGPLAAMTIGGLGHVADFGRPHVRWTTWTAGRALASGAAGLVAAGILIAGNSPVHLFSGVAAAALTEVAIGAVLSALVVQVRGTGTFAGFLTQVRPVLISTVPLYAPVLFVLVYAYERLSAWSLVLFLVPALAAQRLHSLYREQRETTELLREVNERLERASLSFATALVAALDARDQYTAGHSAVVAVYARDIAQRLGLSEEDQQLVHLCGLVHDIGKVGLPAGLLEKPGALTLEERRLMEAHSVIGERILGKVDNYGEIARIVRHHHERVDGQGYPDRLVEVEIPFLSRIIAVADAYNAMTSGRPYRDAMPSRVARFRLIQAAGTQFDAAVVAAFDEVLADASEMYLSGARADLGIESQRQPLLFPQPVAASVA